MISPGPRTKIEPSVKRTMWRLNLRTGGKESLSLTLQHEVRLIIHRSHWAAGTFENLPVVNQVFFMSQSDSGLMSRQALSALPPKADMCGAVADVCYGPKADI